MKKKVIRISTVPLSLHVLLKGQLSMLAETYDVVAVASPGKELKEVANREGVTTIPLAMERKISIVKDLIALCKLIHLFHQEKPWMVHSLTPKAGLLAMLAAWICRVPVRVHTFTGLVFPTTTGIIQQVLIATDRLTCWCATCINPEGKGVKRDLERFHITSKPLSLIGKGSINGIDLSYFDRTPEVMEQAHLLQQDTCVTFCFVGRMVKDKGINELISAFDRLYKTNFSVRLLLIGPFEEQLDPVLPQTKEYILHHPAIQFLGWQSDIRPFLAAADVFVFPSYREGFPNVVIQAGAMGLPCIVTDINGCNEIIIHEVNGLIIPSHDSSALYEAMEQLLNRRRREHLSQSARKMINERYNQEEVWKELAKFYHSLSL